MYSVGEQPGKGRYCCTNCRYSVVLDDDSDRLPPCGNCGRDALALVTEARKSIPEQDGRLTFRRT